MGLEVALKNKANNEVSFFSMQVPFHVLFTENGNMDKSELIPAWKALSTATDKQPLTFSVPNCFSSDPQQVQQKLSRHNVFFVVSRPPQQGVHLFYFSLKTTTNSTVLAEIGFTPGSTNCNVCLRSSQVPVLPFVQQALQQ